MYGEYIGEFKAQKCDECEETYTDSKTTKLIQKAAKEKGVWNLGKKTKVTKTGNPITIRIPKNIATRLELKEGSEIYITPEKNKITINKTE